MGWGQCGVCEGTGDDLNIGRLVQEVFRLVVVLGLRGGGIFHVFQCHVNPEKTEATLSTLTTQCNVKIHLITYVHKKFESVHIKFCFCSGVFS